MSFIQLSSTRLVGKKSTIEHVIPVKKQDDIEQINNTYEPGITNELLMLDAQSCNRIYANIEPSIPYP